MLPRLARCPLLTWLLACGLHAQTSRPEPVRVFLLAGQSNMEGYGKLTTLDALGAHPTQGQLLKQIRKDDGTFVVRDDVFLYYARGDQRIAAPLTAGQGAHAGFIGPELGFGITLGDACQAPVLLIKTAWGGKDLYCDFRPPSAGKPAYAIPGTPREVGASYRQMVAEIHACLDHLDTQFPQLRGRGFQLCGLVWFQGWNDMCADRSIRPQVLDEYASNFAHLVADLRAEFGVPRLPVVVGEVGVDGEQRVSRDMAALRAAQQRIQAQPTLAGTLGYVPTAPFWYAELDTLSSQLAAAERRVRQTLAAQLATTRPDPADAAHRKEVERRVNEALPKALAADPGYQETKAQHDRHIGHWECHYWGSARVYALAGQAFARAMLKLVEKS